MATEIKIITLDKLGKNNTLFKKYIDNADAKAIKTVSIVGRTLKFYREEILTEDSVAVKEITIPETDLSTINSIIGNLQAVVNKLDGEDTVEGSVKAQIKALKTDLEGQITSSEYDDTEIKKTIKAMYRAYFVKKNAARIYKRYQADVDMILEQDGYTDCIITE